LDSESIPSGLKFERILEQRLNYERSRFFFQMEALGLRRISFGWEWSINAVSGMGKEHFIKRHLEYLRPEDHPRVEAILQRTQQDFQELLDILNTKKYPKTRTYIENLDSPSYDLLTMGALELA
jgi:hypothetical protein